MMRVAIHPDMKGRRALKSKIDTIAAPPSTPTLEQASPPSQLHGAPPLLAPAEVRRNYRLGVINGVLFALGDSLSSAGLVLALLVRQLGGSLALVGLLPALQIGGFLLPQMLVGGRLQAMPCKLPLYRRAAVARMSAFGAMLLAIIAAGSLPPTVSLWLIIICYSIFNFGGGTSTLAFQDVVAKVIPPRRRGSFFGTRQLFGGLLTFAIVGPLVGWLLGEAGPLPFPLNYGALVALAWISMTMSLAAFALVKEPPQTQLGKRMHVIEGLRRAPALMRANANYRWFIISRMLTRVGQIAEPFYIIYAIEALGLPPDVAGIYLAVRALAGALSNLLWSQISERQGTRRLILITGILFVLAPTLALAGPAVSRVLGLSGMGLLIAIGLVFLVAGVANDGNGISSNTYLLEIVPEDERPTYIGLANTTLGVVTFLPVLGGWLVANVGYGGTFGLAVTFALLGLAASLQLTEVRLVKR
jgi:MFS family permease